MADELTHEKIKRITDWYSIVLGQIGHDESKGPLPKYMEGMTSEWYFRYQKWLRDGNLAFIEGASWYIEINPVRIKLIAWNNERTVLAEAHNDSGIMIHQASFEGISVENLLMDVLASLNDIVDWIEFF